MAVLDTAPEPVFDDIARMACEICGVPIALIGLIDAERQWFKANVGLPAINEVPRDAAFCAHTILIEDDGLFEVPDATRDTRFAANPLVTGRPDIRFYAGAPLTLPGGERIGTLCVIDREPRRLDATQARLLRSLAGIATQALAMRRALLVRTGRIAGVGGWELDLVTHAMTWSEQTRRIHDVGPDYVPTLAGAIAFFAPETRALIEAAVRLGIERGVPWDLELRFITAKGGSLWVRAAGEVEFSDGVAVRLIGALQDITTRKQLERRLADNERFVRQITDGLPLRIAYIDKDRRYRFVNLAHCRRFGLDRDDILGRTRAELAPPSSSAVVEPTLTAALAGQAQHLEFEEMQHGELRRFDAQLIPDVSETGEIRGVFTTGVDITERAAAERGLRELTTIVDNTTDYVVQTDRHGAIKYMNAAARRASGLSATQSLAQRHFGEFNTPATNRLFADVIVPALQRANVWVGETTVYAADRREIPVSHMVIAHRGADGCIDRYSAVMRDVSAEA
ncbi:MAG TPA: PAS domain-containing protein, partial [Burkholderiaceae bacterium]